MWIPKIATLSEFSQILSSRVNIPSESIYCAKISSPWNFHRIELPFVDWVHLTSELKSEKDQRGSTQYVSSQPFYLSTDGILFIVKDCTVDQRDMTPQEKLLYKCDEFEQWLMAGGSKQDGTSNKRKGAGEQGVKIMVMSK